MLKSNIEPKIELVSEKKLVGFHTTMSFAEYNVAPLWSKFMPRRKEIENITTTDFISMSVYVNNYFSEFNPANQFEKWATVEVMNFDNVPDGMEAFTLSSGLYAIFHYKGLSSDHSIFDYILKTWLPNSIYELDDRPHFEIMGEKYKNNDPTSEEDIFIPIRLKLSTL